MYTYIYIYEQKIYTADYTYIFCFWKRVKHIIINYDKESEEVESWSKRVIKSFTHIRYNFTKNLFNGHLSKKAKSILLFVYTSRRSR